MILPTQRAPAANEFSSLIDLVRFRAADSDDLIYSFLVDGDLEEASMTTGGLDRRARAIAAVLQEAGAGGDRVLLLLAPGLDFIAAFFGCVYAGAVAVPVFTPAPARVERAAPRLKATTSDARPLVVLTDARTLANRAEYATHIPWLEHTRWIDLGRRPAGAEEEWREPQITSESLAFLQYTSGSTSLPKGVMVTHRSVLANSHKICQLFGHHAQSRGVIWLPPYHDMGLIGGILQPLYAGFPVTLMSPFAFLQRPFLWLKAISRKHATTSGGPNFAYDLCVRRINAEQKSQLDLSSWQVAFNGAEPIRAETIDRFTDAFGECGFRREAWYPCYGLAESTLIVTGHHWGRPPVIRTFDARALSENRVVEPPLGSERNRKLVGCGRGFDGDHIAIVEPQTRERCPADRVGEIWVAGPSVAAGFWQQPDETVGTFKARIKGEAGRSYLRTGDLGFVHQGELFLTGRLKHIVIIDGRNHYPEDIERTTERAHPAIRPGGAGAVPSEGVEGESLVVIVELEPAFRRQLAAGRLGNSSLDEPQASDSSLSEEVARAIRQLVAWEHDVRVDRILFVEAGSIPRTSSGKVQRHACRALHCDTQTRVGVTAL